MVKPGVVEYVLYTIEYCTNVLIRIFIVPTGSCCSDNLFVWSFPILITIYCTLSPKPYRPGTLFLGYLLPLRLQYL